MMEHIHQVKLPCTLGAEVWYASEMFQEVWLCTVTAIRADWALGNTNPDKPGVTLTLARKAPSQLTIQTDASDIGRSVFFNEHDAYDALSKWKE